MFKILLTAIIFLFLDIISLRRDCKLSRYICLPVLPTDKQISHFFLQVAIFIWTFDLGILQHVSCSM